MSKDSFPLEHWDLVQTTTEISGSIPDSQMFQTRLKWPGMGAQVCPNPGQAG